MTVQRIIQEPLVHFLAIALVIYGFQSFLRSEATEKKSLTLSAEETAQVKAIWHEKLEREPRQAELHAALSQRLLDNMLFEEALRLGLHREERVIYEMLVTRVKQLLQTPPLSRNIEDALLYAYYQAHQDNYIRQGNTSFSHVFVSIEHRDPFTLANALLKLLQEGNVSGSALGQFGDDLASHDVIEASPKQIEMQFGKSFLTQISQFEKGVWRGPVISNSGIHLVKVYARHGGTVLPYETIKDKVLGDYINDQKRRYYDEKLKELNMRYRIVKERQ